MFKKHFFILVTNKMKEYTRIKRFIIQTIANTYIYLFLSFLNTAATIRLYHFLALSRNPQIENPNLLSCLFQLLIRYGSFLSYGVYPDSISTRKCHWIELWLCVSRIVWGICVCFCMCLCICGVFCNLFSSVKSISMFKWVKMS